MSREIKFRVWANRENRWCVESEYIGCEWGLQATSTESARVNLHLGMGMPQGEVEAYRRDAFTVEQFTGLKDSKGVEIYEGDIMSHQFWMDWQDRRDNPDGTWWNQVVVFNPGHAAFQLYRNTDDVKRGNGTHLTQGVSVVGNIHQNPDLLL